VLRKSKNERDIMKDKYKLLLGLVLAAVLVAGCQGGGPSEAPTEETATPTPTATATPTPEPTATPFQNTADDINGRSIKNFVSSECGGCHNPKRVGATGPDITKTRLHEGKEKDGTTLPPLNRQALLATVKNGRPGTSMPAWSTQDNPIGRPLTDAEMKAIVEYIYTTEAPEKFEYGMDMIKDSHKVLVPKDELPEEPTHDAPMDNIFLAVEREHAQLAAINGETFEVIDHMKAGQRVHGTTFDPDGRYAYNVGRDGWLYRYDLYSMQATRKVRVGTNARGIAVSDNGEYLLAGNYIPTQAVMLDAETLEPLKVFDTHDLENPQGETVDSRICGINDVDSSKVGPYFLMSLKEAGQAWRINYEKEGFPVKKAKGVGNILHELFLRPDNEVFYIASQEDNYVAAINVETMEVQDRIETGAKPHPGPGAVWETEKYGEVAASPHIGEGKNVIWKTSDNEIVGEVSSGAPGLFVRTNEKMEYVWFDSVFPPEPNQITVHEKQAPFDKVETITDGAQTLHPEPDADGSHVLVSDWQGGVIRVYDDETLEQVDTIENVKTPTGVFNIDRLHEPEGH